VLSNYTYSDIVVGYSAQTGPTPSDPVVRSVQAKLDDLADVRDFGAVGDGVADDTDALQRALNQLYCRETNTQIRRSLYFPAGTYRISSSLLIPTYAKLVGEGADCSIILLDTQDSSEPEYVAQFCDSQGNTGLQIEALFNKKLSIFPKPGIDCDDSFFGMYKREYHSQQTVDFSYKSNRFY
jgi:hypothetical protein